MMSLRRGVTLDRQFHKIPVEASCVVHPADVALIKQMGFNFAKVLINPGNPTDGYLIMNSDGSLNTSNIGYIDELVNKFVVQGVPVVVCIHPENAFKTTYLGDATHFSQLLGFYHDFAAYLAARWGRGQVAFELMTEPFGNYLSWNTMLPQMWSAARSGMPNNMLILDADGVADIGHLVNLTPVNDPNVYYSFTTYAPWIFTLQGAYWNGSYYPGLQRVPYPSSPAIIAAQKSRILDFLDFQEFDAYVSAADADLTTYGNDNWNMSKQTSTFAPLVAWNTAHGGNLKIFCAEFGVLDANQATNVGLMDVGAVAADRVQFIKDRRLALEAANISWSYWSFNETFTLLNPKLRVPSAPAPTTAWYDNPTMSALGLPLCGCGCSVQPSSPYDLNKDCYVNMLDFAKIAQGWLICTEPTDPLCTP
jgi:endoglucanase